MAKDITLPGQSGHQSLDSVQTVQTPIKSGKWMFIQEASVATGLSEKTLRRYMKRQVIKVRRLGKSANAKVQLFVTDDFLSAPPIDFESDQPDDSLTEDADLLVEENLTPEEDFSPDSSETSTTRIPTEFRALVEECVRPLVVRLEQQTLILAEQERVIQDQSKQLRLLPDLEKKAEDERKEAELKELEIEALKKQIAALQEESSQLEAVSSQKDQLEKELAAFKKKRSWVDWFLGRNAP